MVVDEATRPAPEALDFTGVITSCRSEIVEALPAWTETLRAWRDSSSPLVEVQARHTSAGFQDLRARLGPDGLLRLDFDRRAGRTVFEADIQDPDVWDAAEQVAANPPSLPAATPPAGSPARSVTLTRADGSELTIRCSGGTFVRSEEHRAAEDLQVLIDGRARRLIDERDENHEQVVPKELRDLPDTVNDELRRHLEMALPGWRAARERWLARSSPLREVRANHFTYQVEAITVTLDVDGRLVAEDRGGPTASRTIVDRDLWQLAEELASAPPPLPAGAPPPGSPGESIAMIRADGTELAISCTPGSYVSGPEHEAAVELVARIIGLGRDALGRPAVRWPGPGPEPMPERPANVAPPPTGHPPPAYPPPPPPPPEFTIDAPLPPWVLKQHEKFWEELPAWLASSSPLDRVHASFTQQHQSESVTVNRSGTLMAVHMERSERTERQLPVDPAIWRRAEQVASDPPTSPAPPPPPEIPGAPHVWLTLTRADGTSLGVQPAGRGTATNDEQRRADELWRNLLDIGRELHDGEGGGQAPPPPHNLPPPAGPPPRPVVPPPGYPPPPG